MHTRSFVYYGPAAELTHVHPIQHVLTVSMHRPTIASLARARTVWSEWSSAFSYSLVDALLMAIDMHSV